MYNGVTALPASATGGDQKTCYSAVLNAGILFEDELQWSTALQYYVQAAEAAISAGDLKVGLTTARRYKSLRARAIDAALRASLSTAATIERAPDLLPAEMHALLARLAISEARNDQGIESLDHSTTSSLMMALRHLLRAFQLSYPAAVRGNDELNLSGDSDYAAVWARVHSVANYGHAFVSSKVESVEWNPGSLLVQQLTWLSYGLALESAGLLERAGQAYTAAAAVAEAGLAEAEAGLASGNSETHRRKESCFRAQAGAAWNNLGNVKQALVGAPLLLVFSSWTFS